MNKYKIAIFLNLYFVLFTLPNLLFSQEKLLKDAWAAFNSDNYKAAIEAADQCIDNFGRKAEEIQINCIKEKIPSPPWGKVSDPEKTKIFSRGLLNDVATALFVKARSAEYIFNKDKINNKKYRIIAETAYNLICSKYEYGRCWDPQGWFWSPCEVGKIRVPID